MDSSFLAFDLGAASGRTLHGRLKQGRLEVREIHRFSNEMLEIDGHLRWHAPRLFEEMKNGLSRAVREMPGEFNGLAVDTWGLDFGLLDPEGDLLNLPVTYRDARTDGMMERFFEVIPREQVYASTGIQFMPINTLFQLHALKLENAVDLKKANALLFMPDLFSHLFSGIKKTEYTIATTSQMIDARTSDWSSALIKALGIAPGLLQEIVRPGTVVGAL
ncbi:MAG: rhamnulokinase, partial [Planctomycetes bacterium]|nr:rhamnulokinase [Planctomycetota bacterium]